MWHQGRKIGERSRKDKISKENKKGRNSKLVLVGFKAGVKYTEGCCIQILSADCRAVASR